MGSALGLAAGGFLDLGFVFAAGAGAGGFGGCGFAGGALDLLALDLVGDGGGICHGDLSLCLSVERNFLVVWVPLP